MVENTSFFPSNEEEAASIAWYRAQTYAAASDVFTSEPDAPQLEALVATAASPDAQNAILPCECCLYAYLQSLQTDNYEQLRSEIATEYAELFVGPRPPLAPLYESVYRGSLHRLNTEITMQVRRMYEQNNLEVVKRNTIPNDHLGLELEFMATLCVREAEALENGNSEECARLRIVQQEFLNDHLGAWIDLFASRVSAAYCANYYDAWARFTQSFVEHDKAYMAQNE